MEKETERAIDAETERIRHERRPLSAAEAKEFVREHGDAWRQVPSVCKEICERGAYPGIQHEIAARTGVWPIFHTINQNSERPGGVGVDCDTLEFARSLGPAPDDKEIEHAANMASAVNGDLILRQVRFHLERDAR